MFHEYSLVSTVWREKLRQYFALEDLKEKPSERSWKEHFRWLWTLDPSGSFAVHGFCGSENFDELAYRYKLEMQEQGSAFCCVVLPH